MQYQGLIQIVALTMSMYVLNGLYFTKVLHVGSNTTIYGGNKRYPGSGANDTLDLTTRVNVV